MGGAISTQTSVTADQWLANSLCLGNTGVTGVAQQQIFFQTD